MKKATERKNVKETIELRRRVISDLKRLNPNLNITSAQSSSIVYVKLESNNKDKIKLPEYSYDIDRSSKSYITFYAKGQAFTICLA